MVPPSAVIEAKLRSAVEEVYSNEETRDSLTVRLIRDKVEKELDLASGFLVEPEWKERSKTLIKSWATKIIDEAELPPQDSIEVEPKSKKTPVKATKMDSPVKKGTKRGANEVKSRPQKRLKKEATPSDISEDEPSELSFDESPVSDFEESDSSDAPKSKRHSKSKSKTPTKRVSKKKAISSDSEDEDISEDIVEDDESDALSTPPKKVSSARKARENSAGRRKSRKPVELSDEESEEDIAREEESIQEKHNTPKKTTAVKKSTPAKEPTPATAKEETEAKANDSDSSEMSILIDPSPKPKQKRRSKSEVSATSAKPSKASSKAAKAAKAPKTVKPKPVKDLTAAEAEIKTLQSHLVKCGMRKIWGFELKQYGDDSKAKIRHLQGMLNDIGMVGRFSEQRAREIKELRELQADLEAVKEGDSKWGLESGKRNRGAARKSFKEPSDDDEDDDEDGNRKATESRSTSEQPSKAALAARARQEFAFLGDDDESDSD